MKISFKFNYSTISRSDRTDSSQKIFGDLFTEVLHSQLLAVKTPFSSFESDHEGKEVTFTFTDISVRNLTKVVTILNKFFYSKDGTESTLRNIIFGAEDLRMRVTFDTAFDEQIKCVGEEIFGLCTLGDKFDSKMFTNTCMFLVSREPEEIGKNLDGLLKFRAALDKVK